jgi:hypothetical protein
MIKLHTKPMLIFSDYKKTSLYFTVGLTCSFKCMKDIGITEYDNVSFNCHNIELVKNSPTDYSKAEIWEMCKSNPFIESFVMGGLEPLDNMLNTTNLISCIREVSEMDIVVYTGYNKSEVGRQINELSNFKNIIVKFGRFIPNSTPSYDDVLGVYLASSNQYSEKIS